MFAAFIAVAFYNSLELLVLIFATFKRYRGRYFWCLLVASFSIILHALAFLLKLFHLSRIGFLNIAIVDVSWVGMVTGQSMVLWSRLHLVAHSEKILRAALWMIMIDAIVLHIPTSVLQFCTNSPNPPAPFVKGYDTMERIQLIVFCVQEIILSTIYIWETVKMLRLRPGRQSQIILRQLLIINVIIVVLDASVIGIQYAGYYAVQVTIKPMVYSIKLKLEFAILGKLVKIAKAPRADTQPSTTSTTRMVTESVDQPGPVIRQDVEWNQG
ncbi:hypothetical protein BGZ61DRAFT_369830 [Ilyonectria robusta]|uniref:uncharacterized protein n=1 Tax=Ilyonectria robusta TaxID=1079257 RepID=UPI001E8D2C87|nr:uncharacterized protein BGZ61DRAFT_369870 [Ilyonectria robusta]XP_046096058.1 uncharacterized protein BGZ61DRAFT_369830 [Ilyonectria robusta]KAH8661048.1 hypothetical protein BGZ61DRAFT_369870 [Ilyonectria robusta]KAH8661088.1 hypothetical protein BGZ61DRAFT_369830 [Ilyonectria robusta]